MNPLVLLLLGVGGYLLYKKSQASAAASPQALNQLNSDINTLSQAYPGAATGTDNSTSMANAETGLGGTSAATPAAGTSTDGSLSAQDQQLLNQMLSANTSGQ